MASTGPRTKRRRTLKNSELPVQPAKLAKPDRQPSLRQVQISSLLKASKSTSAIGRAKRIATTGKEGRNASGPSLEKCLEPPAQPASGPGRESVPSCAVFKGQKRDLSECRPEEAPLELKGTEGALRMVLQPCQKRHRSESEVVAVVLPPSDENADEAVQPSAGIPQDSANGKLPDSETVGKSLKETSEAAKAACGSSDDSSVAIIGGIDEAFAKALLSPPVKAGGREEEGEGVVARSPLGSGTTNNGSMKPRASLLLRELRDKGSSGDKMKENGAGAVGVMPVFLERKKKQPASVFLRELREKAARAEKAVVQEGEGAAAVAAQVEEDGAREGLLAAVANAEVKKGQLAALAKALPGQPAAIAKAQVTGQPAAVAETSKGRGVGGQLAAAPGARVETSGMQGGQLAAVADDVAGVKGNGISGPSGADGEGRGEGATREIRGGWAQPWELANSARQPLQGYKSRAEMMIGLLSGKAPAPPTPPPMSRDEFWSPGGKAKEQGKVKESVGLGGVAFGKGGEGRSPVKGKSPQRPRAQEQRKASTSPKKILPERLQILATQFAALATAHAMLKSRRQMCTWERVVPVIEGMTNRRFSLAQLTQLCHVMHDAIRLERVRIFNPDDALNLSSPVWDLEINILDPPAPSSNGTPPRGSSLASSWRHVLQKRLEELATTLPEDAPLPQVELPRAPSSAPALPQPQAATAGSPGTFCTPTPKRPTAPNARGAPPSSSASPCVPPRRRQVSSSPALSLASPVSAATADLAGARRNLQSMLQSASKLLSEDSIPPVASERPASGAPPEDPAVSRRGEAEELAVQMVDSLDCSRDEIMRVIPPELLRSMQEKAQVQARENSKEAVNARRRGQMVSQLPHMLDVLRSVFQRASRTVFPRQQLLSHLLAPHRGIVDRKEVDEQLELMLELAPEWFSSKKSISGETLYRIDKNVNLAIIRKRLVSP